MLNLTVGMDQVHIDRYYAPVNSYCDAQAKPGCKLMRVQTIVLVRPETLMQSHRLTSALMDFEHAQIFHKSQ